MKRDIKLTIESTILEEMKENVPNISKFVQECMEAYLSFKDENDNERGDELREAMNNLNMEKVKIHLLMNANYEHDMVEQIQNKKLDMVWVRLWNPYKKTGNYQPDAMKEAIEVLDMGQEKLELILDEARANYKMNQHDVQNSTNLNNWEYILEMYGDIEPVIDEELEAQLKELGLKG